MMRKTLLFLLLIFFFSFSYSQNLVPNPSFELHSLCPDNYNQVTYATGWQKSLNNNNPVYHTEYLNACSSDPLFQVPSSTWGFQTAYTGQAYMALNTMAPSVFVGYRENIFIKLSTPLIVGAKYDVAFQASHTDNSQNTTNNLGVKFSTIPDFPINNISQVYSSAVITDNINWSTISGSFIADSAYQYLAIGNFFTDANTTRIHTYPGAFYNLDAYFIDEVSVALNCAADTSVISVSPSTISVAQGSSTALIATGGGTFSWTPTTGLSCASCSNPIASPNVSTTYTVTVTSSQGCSRTTTAEIKIENDCPELFVPNVFSPNYDNENDALLIGGTKCVATLHFIIFNRWGQTVFESNSVSQGWDGRNNGKKCEQGVYFYLLHATFNDDTSVNKSGSVSLFR